MLVLIKTSYIEKGIIYIYILFQHLVFKHLGRISEKLIRIVLKMYEEPLLVESPPQENTTLLMTEKGDLNPVLLFPSF